MSLKQYSRKFLLEKENDRHVDFQVLSEIDPNFEFLTYNGKKRILKLNHSKRIQKEIPEKKTAMLSPSSSSSSPSSKVSNIVQSKNNTNSSQGSTNSRPQHQLSNSIGPVIDCFKPDMNSRHLLQKGVGIQPHFPHPYPPVPSHYLPVSLQSTVHYPIPQDLSSNISSANHQQNTVPRVHPHFGPHVLPLVPPRSSQNSLPANEADNINPTRLRPHSDHQEKVSVTEDDGSLKELKHQFEMRLKTEQELFTMKTKLEWSEREHKIRDQNIKVIREIKNEHFKELQKIRAEHFEEFQNLKAQHFEDLQTKEETMYQSELQKTLQEDLLYNEGHQEKDNEKEEKLAQAAKDLDTIKELEEALKTSLELNESQLFELNTLNDFLKKRLEEKNNELEATQIAAKDELDMAKKEFENELKANQLAGKQELDDAKREFEQIMQLSEMLMTESKDKAWVEMINILDTELECHICTEIFIDADILSTCRHVFCHHCIMRYVTTYAADWNHQYHHQQMTCPMCRSPFMERDVQPFPMGRSLVAKIEDKLSVETIQRRIQLKAERGSN